MNNQVFSTQLVHDMNVHFLKTNKYKTNLLVLNIVHDLTEESVTKIAMLPSVLKMGSTHFPSLKKLQEKLDSLYGALFYAQVFKRGEKQIVQFSIEIANEKYLSEEVSLLSEALKLLGEIVTKPNIKDNGFNEEYIELEKNMLTNRIKSVLDDKIFYAQYKTLVHMCKNEPYRLLEYGKMEDINQITRSELYQFYTQWLATSPIDLFVVGNFEEQEIIEEIDKSFRFLNRNIRPLSKNIVDVSVSKEKNIIEKLDITQGKLNIGIRTYTTILDENYISLLLYNGLLGGYAHSKLFTNVREKASLAYYASSGIDSHKGILTIQSGIESKNFTKALEIIKQQLELLKDGEITKEELNLTKSLYSNQLKEIIDKPRQFVDFAYHSVLSGKKRSIDEILNGIEETSIDDIVQVAQKVKVDTVYFLQGKDKEGK